MSSPLPPPRNFRPGAFAYHDEIELVIVGLDDLGCGYGIERGVRVLVPFTLPGEKVRARIYANRSTHSDADLMAILEPSPDRVKPVCSLFGQCGGCQFQQWDYAAQLRWKHAQVKKLFEAIAPGVDVNSVIASPRTYGYRSKITPHFEPPRVGDAPVIGFLRHNSRTRYVDVEKCPIAMEEINAALPAARAGITDTIATFKRGSTLLMRVAEGRVFTNHKDIITETVGDSLRLKFPAGGFFQNNPFLLPQFAAYAVGEARKGGATFLVDAYCGSGLFALSAAPFFRKVVGVELSEASVVQARENAQLNNVAHASFVLGDAARIFDGLALPPMETAVIIDPPRKGCDENFLAQLVQFAPVTIVYISCNPHTQARDLEPLLRAGYRVNAIQPFDLFPQTKHLECVVTLCVVR